MQPHIHLNLACDLSSVITCIGAIAMVVDDALAHGFIVHGTVTSPIAGARSGNIEELIHLTLPGESS